MNTLAVNYRGAPFMTSLNDNRPLMYALLSVGLFSVALASNMLPDVSSQFEIIIFPAEFRKWFNFGCPEIVNSYHNNVRVTFIMA